MKTVLEKYYEGLQLIFMCIIFISKATCFPLHDFANYYFGCSFLNIPKDHSWQSLNNQIKIRQLICFDENIQKNANFSI